MAVSTAHNKNQGKSYNGNFPAEVVLDLADFDSIRGVIFNDLGKLWKSSARSYIHRRNMTHA